MYQLNSMAPFMSERVGDFDKMVPYYTPYSSSMYTYMPTKSCLLYTSPSPRDLSTSRMPSSA